jgi:galactose mutarotase-like enzyme
MSDDESTWISVASEQISARINPYGAQLSVLRDPAGLDLLWNGDAAVWSGRAPILFPIVGALAGGAYRLGSGTYVLSRHGFARGKPFEVIEANAAAALFRLKADESTQAVYPFEFELDIQFEVYESTLAVTALVRNNGDRDMPASIGFHPAFRWPLPYGQAKSGHFIEFEVDEPAPIRRLNAQGLLTPTPVPSSVRGRRLTLEDALFKDDAVIFDRARSRSVLYGSDDAAHIRVRFPDAPYLGIWSKPGDFICIEPWHGIADPDGYRGDFREKPGVFTVAPDATFETRMEITWLPPKGSAA